VALGFRIRRASEMKIAVQGLWHLGVVTAASLTSLGFDVVAFDYDETLVKNLKQGKLPVDEPGVSELLDLAEKSEKINFTYDPTYLKKCDVFWLTYDTPVDDQDIANVDFVFTEFEKTIMHLDPNTFVLISSQLPVGSARKLKELASIIRPTNRFKFGVQPENLRLGKSLKSFLEAERIIVGTETALPEEVLENLYSRFKIPIIWMSLESAEMTKHAINAFLATSITFMGEISDICEVVSANARDVEKGLRSDSRIGNKAYVSPGLGFAGGTLARDIKFLENLQENSQGMISAVIGSNRIHNDWAERKFLKCFKDRKELKVLFVGLTYTQDTSTLRRSAMLELASKLTVLGHDVDFVEDLVIVIPDDLASKIHQVQNYMAEPNEYDAIFLSKNMGMLESKSFITNLLASNAIIFDPAGLLLNDFNMQPSLSRYFTVGQANAN
jgi:UDPglucose 6-dehydrogenase